MSSGFFYFVHKISLKFSVVLTDADIVPPGGHTPLSGGAEDGKRAATGRLLLGLAAGSEVF